MALWLRARTALTENPTLAANPHIGFSHACNSSASGSDTFFWPLWVLLLIRARAHTHTYTEKQISKEKNACITSREMAIYKPPGGQNKW